MSVTLIAHRIFLGLLFCASICAQTPVIVFENSTNYSGKFNQSANEYGEEIVLGGSARVVSQFQFEYVGNFTAQGDESARVRFYANNGPAWMGNKDYLTPTPTPLFETVIPIGTGFNTATINVPYITVPNNFTWTIKFFGISMAANDTAGLLFYGKPILGRSFNDYWELLTIGWTPQRVAGLTNNFSAKIMALDAAPPPPSLALNVSGGNLVLSWSAAVTGLYLESKPAIDGGVWTPVYPLALRVGDVFQSSVPIGAGNCIFRLNSKPEPPVSIVTGTDSVRVRWSAAVGGQKLQSKTSFSDATWTDLPTPTRPIGEYYEAVIPAGSGASFFRLSRAQ